jgi:hypothetical protein
MKGEQRAQLASPTDIIMALMACEDDENVCEICTNIGKIGEMRETWVGSDARGESITHCKDCTVQ